MKSQARDRQAGTGRGWAGRQDVDSGEGYTKLWTFVSNLMGTGGSEIKGTSINLASDP